MSGALATLRRGARLVWLHDALLTPAQRAQAAEPAGVSPAQRLDPARARPRILREADAEQWLQHWRGDIAALAALRQLAQRMEPGASWHAIDDADLMRRLARRIGQGALRVLEGDAPQPLPVLPAIPPAPAVAEPPAVPLSQLAAPRPPAPPLLPLLEEVRIEGAEVLPEIEQSLEQVSLGIGEIELAPVSLAPAPSKVPAIRDAMKQAGDDITGTLDEM